MRERVRGLSNTTIGAASILVLSAVVAIATGGLLPRMFPPEGQIVEAVFSDTGKLAKGDPVRVRGLDAGKVEEIAVDAGGRTAKVRMKLVEDVPVHADARAYIRWRTVLGGNLALYLDRGTPGKARLGSTPIPLDRTTTQVELDEVTTALDAKARRGLQRMLGELPSALRDEQAPEAALGTLQGLAPTIGRAADALRGKRDGELSELVVDAAQVSRALDTPTNPVRGVVEGAATTVQATARREADIREMLDRFPQALRGTMRTMQRLDVTLALADPLIARLQQPAAELAPTARALRPVLVDADRLLRDAVPLLRSLRPATTDLARTSRDAVPLIDALDPSLARIDKRILPKLAEVDPVSDRPTYQMIGPTFAGVTGAAAQFDGRGHLLHFAPTSNLNAPNTAPCREFMTDPEREEVLLCEGLLRGLGKLFGSRSRKEGRP